MTNTTSPRHGAHYDAHRPAVVIDGMTITEPAVVAESRRWASGSRGPVAADATLDGADLAAFVEQALVVGAHAIGTAGGVQEKFNLESLVDDVGKRTATAVDYAKQATTEATAKAAQSVSKASADAQAAMEAAGSAARTSFAENVDAARRAVTDEITRLVGGEHPELIARLAPVLASFGRDLDQRAAKQAAELIASVSRQFDPADPTSPLAKQNAELARQQKALAESVGNNLKGLESKVDQLYTAVQVDRKAVELASVTPLKGGSYADAVHRLMTEIAAGLGDEYVDTSDVAGVLARNKKGDGLLSIDGGAVKIVLEMTDSARVGWNAYLATAEQNREAVASLGLVRTSDQLHGHSIQILSARRIVLAFDPATDDPALLRTVVQLLRIGAIAAGTRHGTAEVHTAQDKVTEAIALLAKIDSIRHLAGLIKGNATKIDRESEIVHAELGRLLAQANAALTAVTEDGADADGIARTGIPQDGAA